MPRDDDRRGGRGADRDAPRGRGRGDDRDDDLLDDDLLGPAVRSDGHDAAHVLARLGLHGRDETAVFKAHFPYDAPARKALDVDIEDGEENRDPLGFVR